MTNPETGIRHEGKYSIIEGLIQNCLTLESIPDDEPVMIFRAKDILALQTIGFYLTRCLNSKCSAEHLAAILERYEEFRKYAEDHDLNMKIPD